MPFSCFLFRRTGILLKFAQNRLEIHLCDKVATLPRRSLHIGSQGEARRFGWGWYHYPRSVSHVSETLRGQGGERQTVPLLGLGRGRSRRTQRASEQRCAHACRCSEASRPRWAALLCLQFGDVAVFSLCAQYFLNVRDTGGITTLGVLCMLPKCRTAACQSD